MYDIGDSCADRRSLTCYLRAGNICEPALNTHLRVFKETTTITLMGNIINEIKTIPENHPKKLPQFEAYFVGQVRAVCNRDLRILQVCGARRLTVTSVTTHFLALYQ